MDTVMEVITQSIADLKNITESTHTAVQQASTQEQTAEIIAAMHTQHLLQTEAMNRLVASLVDLDKRITRMEAPTRREPDIPSPQGGIITPIVSARPLTPISPTPTPTDVTPMSTKELRVARMS